MRTMTATEASRNFLDPLDAIEQGETVTIAQATSGHTGSRGIGVADRLRTR
jgi:hypothetical protein